MLRNKCTAVAALALALGSWGVSQLALATTDAGPAVRAERPAVKVGDRWRFSCVQGRNKSERLWLITFVDATTIKGTWNGQPLVMSVDLNEIESPEHANSDERLLSFPLESGMQWKSSNDFVDHTNKDVKGSEEYGVRVHAYETVRVPAGEFDAFKLKAQSRFKTSDGGSGTHDFTYWYAPAARAVVRSKDTVTWFVGRWFGAHDAGAKMQAGAGLRVRHSLAGPLGSGSRTSGLPRLRS